MRRFIKKNIYSLALVIVVLIISYLNFTPNTYLSGWDTLHPEFDFPLNFKRLIFGVFREEQGLGAVAGHSHMADLPRVFILWVLNFIFPTHTLRYIYLFLCLAIGPLGIYYLVRQTLKKGKSLNLTAFLSSLFYLLNFSTVQQFYTPFEMFPTQYAFLPWIILYSLKVIKEGGKRNLLIFSFITLLSTPQAYAAHLWYSFFVLYLLFLFILCFFSKRRLKTFKKSLVLLILTLTINSFWLLPNLYFIKTSGQIPKESKQNRLFSQEYRLRNREHGYLKDVALIKGFYFNWHVYDFVKDKVVFLMPKWRDHSKNLAVLSIGYLFFAGAVLGIILSFIKRQKLFIAFLPFFAIPFIILINHTPPFEQLFNFLLKIPLFEEALRFVFTKFSILLAFSYAVYFSFFLYFILKNLKRASVIFLSSALVVSLFVYTYPIFQGNLISDKVKIRIPSEYFSFWQFMKDRPDGKVLLVPLHVFSGWQFYRWGYQGAGFIWFGLKQPILDRDFDRWSISNEQAFREFHYSIYARNAHYFVANLKKYNIAYILWDKNIITPYQKNRKQIIYEREINEILEELERKLTIFKLETFGRLDVYKINQKEDNLTQKNLAFKITPAYRWSHFDFAFYQHGDYFSDGFSDEDANSSSEFYYPFRTYINSQDKVRDNLLEIDQESSSYYLKSLSPSASSQVYLPDPKKTEDAVFANLYIKKLEGRDYYELLFNPLLPKNFVSPAKYQAQLVPLGNFLRFSLNGKSFQVEQDTIESTFSLYLGQVLVYFKQPNFLSGSTINLEFQVFEKPIHPFTLFSKLPLRKISYSAKDVYKINIGQNGLSLSDSNGKKTLSFKSKNFQTGAFINLDHLPHSLGYLFIFRGRNVEGLPLRICLKNLYSNLCDIYEELSSDKKFTDDYFLLPATDSGLGYGLSIDNLSYGNYDSVNELEEVTIYPFPYSLLSQIYYEKEAVPKLKNESKETNDFEEQKISPFLWRLKLAPGADKTSATLVLHQSYHPGWRAYAVKQFNNVAMKQLSNFFAPYLPFLFGQELKEHILVNNWANGWQIDKIASLSHCYIANNSIMKPCSNGTIYIIFWPQYLQFLGFILLILTFALIWRHNKPKINLRG